MRRQTAAAEPDASDGERPSKTARKRSAHDLQSLGEALCVLPDTALTALELPEPLRDAIAEVRRTRSHEGRRRQMQYIGKLMRDVDDVEPLRDAVARERLPGARETLALHRVERWRDVLLADDAALAGFVAECGLADTQRLRALLRAARAEAADDGARKGRAYRELFQWLKEALNRE